MSSSPEWAAWPAWPTRLERRRMPVDEYLGLPEGIHAEYVDGEAIVSPPASRGHGKVQFRLAGLLERSLPGLDVGIECGWRHAGRYRIPDVAVFPMRNPDVVYDDQTPVLVVEVLSPSTASEDTVRKAGEYQAAGVDQYWIVDRAARTLAAFGNNGHGWDRLLDLDEERRNGAVAIGEWGDVPLDLADLFRP